MVFYEAKVRYKSIEELPFDGTASNNLTIDKDSEHAKRDWRETIEDINRELGAKCALDGELSVYVWNAREGLFEVIMACGLDMISMSSCRKFMKEFMVTNYSVEAIELYEVKEISAERFNQLGDRGDNQGFIRRWVGESCDVGTDYFNNSQFKIHEKLAREEHLSKKTALIKAERALADKTFLEELNRVYCDENEKKYYGNPVHYKISASNIDSIMEIVDVLVPALYANKRLLSRRITRISDIEEGCYNESDMENLFENAKGSTVVIELAGSNEDHGNYASSYQRVVDYFQDLVRKYQVNTLCIFAESTEHPGFTKEMVSKLQDDIDIVEIKEGFGDKERAISYLMNLTKEKGVKTTKKELSDLLGTKNIFSTGEIYNVYKKWFQNDLKHKHYKAYSSLSAFKIDDDKKAGSPYEELQEMIGLTEIKKVVDEIIDTTRLQTARSKMGLDTFKSSKHMIFTGNPGSAKTTVARLLAQILREEGVIDYANIVECGRADLVGVYVGQTAPKVRQKFIQAIGGILFIDEAYSLVSDDGYGDEAITTIVQEMENHRDDVIVIFAGYPDKMKKFLDKNEGLRSRIAFHLDFPDYSADEMTDILRLMIKKKGYIVTEDIIDKCREIFKIACRDKEFGNGRYARNLLEQAEMAQSRRVIAENKGKKLTKIAVLTLKAEDFDVNLAKKTEREQRRPMGFAV